MQQCLEKMLQEAQYDRSAGAYSRAVGKWLWALQVGSSSAELTRGSLPWSFCCYQITALKLCQTHTASLGFPVFSANVLVVRRGRLDGSFQVTSGLSFCAFPVSSQISELPCFQLFCSPAGSFVVVAAFGVVWLQVKSFGSLYNLP